MYITEKFLNSNIFFAYFLTSIRIFTSFTARPSTNGQRTALAFTRSRPRWCIKASLKKQDKGYANRISRQECDVHPEHHPGRQCRTTFRTRLRGSAETGEGVVKPPSPNEAAGRKSPADHNVGMLSGAARNKKGTQHVQRDHEGPQESPRAGELRGWRRQRGAAVAAIRIGAAPARTSLPQPISPSSAPLQPQGHR